MKLGIVVSLLLIIASPALANPPPAGKCSLVDDGVRQLGGSSDPRALSMIVPPILGNSVVDVAFRINSDGSVAGLKVLCISIPGNGIEASILAASKNWRFSPVTQGGKPISSAAAYRLSATGKIPLPF